MPIPPPPGEAAQSAQWAGASDLSASRGTLTLGMHTPRSMLTCQCQKLLSVQPGVSQGWQTLLQIIYLVHQWSHTPIHHPCQ